VVDDRQLTVVLGRFARLAARLVEDPAAWLGTEPVPGPGPVLGRLRRMGVGVRHLLVGRTHPGAPGWDQIPLQDRCQWWVRRIQAVAAPIAATPRIAGALADRVPLQGALGEAAAGLAVCAVAHEHGVQEPEDWVPLLARVLFDRDLTRPAQVPSLAEAGADGDPNSDPNSGPNVDPNVDPNGDEVPAPPGIPRRAASALWRLARELWALPGLFDERPRGGLLWRALGKVPVVGLPAGVLDERGAVRSAAEETRELLVSRR
jgi:hypothetical protein